MSEKTAASLRELFLRITDKAGVDLSEKVIKEIEEERACVKALEFGEVLSDVMVFRINKRGPVLNWREVCIAIMELPKDSTKGLDRKAMKQIESLLDKLDGAEGCRSILLEEGEWKTLRDRVEDHPFPGYSKGVRLFQDSVIDETKKVAVGKVEKIA